MSAPIRPFTVNEDDDCEECPDLDNVGDGHATFTEARDLAADVAVFVQAALELRSYGATAIKVNEYYVEFPPLPKPRKRVRKK